MVCYRFSIQKRLIRFTDCGCPYFCTLGEFAYDHEKAFAMFVIGGGGGCMKGERPYPPDNDFFKTF